MPKIILAHSGTLGSLICIHALAEHHNFSVVTLSIDVGQGEYLEPSGEQALAVGATSARVEDRQERFAEEFVLPALQAQARHASGYLLGVALSRPLIVDELVRAAHETNCTTIAHATHGESNDYARFATCLRDLRPPFEILAPLEELGLQTQAKQIEYAQKHKIPFSEKDVHLTNFDQNIWGVSLRCGDATDLSQPPPANAYHWTVDPLAAPDQPRVVEITFESGRPVALDGQEVSLLDLIRELNRIGGEHGVGRLDVIEDTLTATKSRQVYEAPAATILYAAHRALSEIILPRELLHYKAALSQKYSEIVYTGMWFNPLRTALDAFFRQVQEKITGTVHVQLAKGACSVVGRASPHSRYAAGKSSP